ncbi:MAG: cell division ATP-binding protein FtsE [Candidatus Jacksonbacteria bacterium RIFOXYA2_FULL_44_7]|uniref:Cell division ATP-binding protein FtsE n=1 Tax=Candidatus Jacksonbacteria bacterium RIFCSPLOWO2_02_FULL_44_20 TaxID=1798460 RepID=A0A1G2AC07_9BACT|nr:MAG: Cell division ATP-binding protein FtsE [Parcubacteria group bacterium GW2011_GWC2_44_17]KKT50371.1 MAG: Cell division ATP-binding protein FtsE [Parcubacteria group bacterium GW2011_GWF2_44_17]OGY70684.1 MAG: cell division ATP-binding protein FtsE [Candidatus Jacksonbacteria bacterium RIFCSPHIGHO2_12_FULL_44_12]OGY70872.1 MAG: cell division ATP-binding protein FtsE [Candidatus Jacksonbacteria bacterium RIFCSPHIGHO2_02_FULL_44_25]OGY72950.1 MAG: cell division ATP-binding protein FtsE [Can
MIIFQSVTKHYPPNVTALEDVNLHVKPGEFVSIVGQSGTGKTTLIKLLTAEERPTTGMITVGGWDITRLLAKDKPYLRRQIGVIFQDFKLLPKKTAAENVSFALEVAGKHDSLIRKTVNQLLRIVGLEEMRTRYPRHLSGGEQQRVAIARALAHRPKIIVADEPTGNLDAIHTRDIIDLLVKINQFGTTVLLVTHDREVVNSLRKRVITLENGRIVNDQEHGRYML